MNYAEMAIDKVLFKEFVEEKDMDFAQTIAIGQEKTLASVGQKEILVSFVPKIGGALRFRVVLTPHGTNVSYGYTVKFFRNGVVQETESGSVVNSAKSHEFLVDVSPYEKFDIEVSLTSKASSASTSYVLTATASLVNFRIVDKTDQYYIVK